MRDYHSGILIGAGGRWLSDWPARVLANDVSTRIDRKPAREERSIARVQAQVAATISTQGLAEFCSIKDTDDSAEAHVFK